MFQLTKQCSNVAKFGKIKKHIIIYTQTYHIMFHFRHYCHHSRYSCHTAPQTVHIYCSCTGKPRYYSPLYKTEMQFHCLCIGL